MWWLLREKDSSRRKDYMTGALDSAPLFVLSHQSSFGVAAAETATFITRHCSRSYAIYAITVCDQIQRTNFDDSNFRQLCK